MHKHLFPLLMTGAIVLAPALSFAEDTSSSASSSSTVSSSSSSEMSASSTSSTVSSSSSASSVKQGPCANLQGRYYAACVRKMHLEGRSQRVLSRIKNVLEKFEEKLGSFIETRRNLRRELGAAVEACKNTRGDDRIACLKKQSSSEGSGGGGTVCPADAKLCPDGSSVARDPSNRCEFKKCKGDVPIACTDDVRQCPDGSFVPRDPAHKCEFKECPPVNCVRAPCSSSSSSSSKAACRIDNCGQSCVSSEQPFMGKPCNVEDADKAACYRGSVCEKQRDGTCGWTLTSDTNECLLKQK